MKIAPEENCPSDNYPPDNCPLDDCPRGYLPPVNCPRGKLIPGKFPPRHKISSKNNCPHAKGTTSELKTMHCLRVQNN